MNFVMSAIILACMMSGALIAVGFQDFKERQTEEGFDVHMLLDKNQRISNFSTIRPNPSQNSRGSYIRERVHRMNSDGNTLKNGDYQSVLENHSKIRIFKTHGKGMVKMDRGGMANVPNFFTQNETTRLDNKPDANPEQTRYRAKKYGGKYRRRVCKRMCPPNRSVVAIKGQNFVLLPEPCPTNRWNQLSGPQPGEMVHEGAHLITGTLGLSNKFCQFQYHVLVRSCEPLNPQQNGTRIKCSSGNIWGSNCTVYCGKGKKAEGPTDLECTDDLTWSNPIPKCKSVRTCSMPKIKSNSRIWCQTANLVPTRGDSIPEGSSCRFYKNGKIIAVTCKKGIWRGIRKIPKISTASN